MSRRATSWVSRITLQGSDTLRLRNYILQEMRYHNALVNGFGGPMRTMASTFQSMTGALEALYGEVAATGIDVRSLKESTLPARFKPFTSILFRDGRLAVDSKTLLLLDVASSAATLEPTVRRNLAVEMLRHARDQSAAFANPVAQDDQVYKYAMETVTPIESRNKRHLQLPRSAVNTAIKDDKMAIGTPYIRTPLIVSAPQTAWNYIVLRDEDDGYNNGAWAVELSQEATGYLLRKMDSGFRKPRRDRFDDERPGHQGKYSRVGAK